MKSFLISISLLSVFVILTALNCIQVTRILTDISDRLEELPESSDNVIPKDVPKKSRQLYDDWKKESNYLSLTVNVSELRDMSVVLGNLAAFSESDAGADYNAALSDAKLRISLLRERERLSLSGIF